MLHFREKSTNDDLVTVNSIISELDVRIQNLGLLLRLALHLVSLLTHYLN
jgi:hypothetical protein